MNLIDGKNIASSLKNEIKNEIDFIKSHNDSVGLAVIIVGEDPAATIYLNSKKKLATELGIDFYEYHFLENVTDDEIIDQIKILNNDNKINGIFIEMPLPVTINKNKILSFIDPYKDVDCLNPVSLGMIMSNIYSFAPCTAKSVMELLSRSNIDVSGKHVVILGRSNVVGKPLALLMLNKNATVTICHSKTENIENISKTADILVVAIGQKKFVNKNFVKDGAVVIDVGMHRDIIDGKSVLSGDVDFDDVKNVCSYITPVPGGVGPMTSVCIMKNCLDAKINFG